MSDKERFADALAFINTYNGDIEIDKEYEEAKRNIFKQYLQKFGEYPKHTYVKVLKETKNRPALWVITTEAPQFMEYLENNKTIELN